MMLIALIFALAVVQPVVNGFHSRELKFFDSDILDAANPFTQDTTDAFSTTDSGDSNAGNIISGGDITNVQGADQD